ncbi:DUF6578 domain-containing protein [Streptomyces sp. NPDC005202]|uniref:DUF6578 domain-containing protein n=1 Tax=Streptomyces sp. NPDC005202 TaxID=3157021 RepID=UPI0033A04561
MGLWRVFYEGWQMECCGRPFSVGEEVGWPLAPLDPEDAPGEGDEVDDGGKRRSSTAGCCASSATAASGP